MKKILFLLLPCLLLTGCRFLPSPREMEDMALVRTMGVDASGEELLLTAAPADGEEIYSANAPTLAGACLDMKGQGEQFLFFGCADQMILGETFAERGIIPVLEGLAGDGELSLGAYLWIQEGGQAEHGVSTIPERRLETMRRDSALGTAALTRTAGEIYADLLDWGTAWVPALTLEEDETLTQSGYAVLERDQFRGVLKGENARGLELLLGKPRREQLEAEGKRVWLIGADTDCRFRPRGTLLINCHVVVRLSEGDPMPENDKLKEALEEQLTRRLNGTLEELRSWGTDCAGLGRQAGCYAPILWRKISAEWPERFRENPPEVRVRVTLRPH